MRNFSPAGALLLLACAAAAAQTPAPSTNPPAAPAAAAPAQKPAEPRKPLILRLDEIEGPRMHFGASPDEKYQPAELPSLGGDTRSLENARSIDKNRASPYPSNSGSDAY